MSKKNNIEKCSNSNSKSNTNSNSNCNSNGNSNSYSDTNTNTNSNTNSKLNGYIFTNEKHVKNKYCDSFELLAPVGGIEHLRAAVQNGANAVYLGGKLFNARINAQNFDDEQMERAIDYAHARDTKVYITMNTLMTEEELAFALEYADKLYRIGADALIVQDMGLASLVRKYIPKFHLHLSTQGTIYNADGVRLAGDMGFERVVLARELSISEIGSCCMTDGPEIEVFVHGALCICYSGQCNMSRINGGRSGNRGLCAQPCRLRYTAENGESKHWLSPKDLCGIDHLADLKMAGVKSLKIEGRMKSPEYVAGVVGIYRKYIDMLERDGYYHVSNEDRKTLVQIFNRGGFTSSYYEGESTNKMMAFDMPKHRGVYIGKVLRRIDENLIEIELEKGENLAMGDGVEVHAKTHANTSKIVNKGASQIANTNQNINRFRQSFFNGDEKKMPGNVVTYLKEATQRTSMADRKGNFSQAGRKDFASETGKNGSFVNNGRASIEQSTSNRLIIGDIKGKVCKGDKIYKITDKELIQNLRRTFESELETDKILRKSPIGLFVKLTSGESAEITAYEFEAFMQTEAQAQGMQTGAQAQGRTQIQTMNLFEKSKYERPQKRGNLSEDLKQKKERFGDGKVLYEGLNRTTLIYDDLVPEPAHTRPLTQERVREQLTKCGDFPFCIAQCDIEMSEGITIPISALNRMRREALSKLLAQKIESYKPKNCEFDLRDGADENSKNTRDTGKASMFMPALKEQSFNDNLLMIERTNRIIYIHIHACTDSAYNELATVLRELSRMSENARFTDANVDTGVDTDANVDTGVDTDSDSDVNTGADVDVDIRADADFNINFNNRYNDPLVIVKIPLLDYLAGADAHVQNIIEKEFAGGVCCTDGRSKSNISKEGKIHKKEREGAFISNKKEMIEYEISPYIPNVTKGTMDRFVEENINEIKDKLGVWHKNSGVKSDIKGNIKCETKSVKIYAGNIAHAKRLADEGLCVVGDYGLNVTNAIAKQSLINELGLYDCVEALEFSTGVCGRAPLMISEHLIDTGELKDNKGRSASIIKPKDNDKSILVKKVDDIHEIISELSMISARQDVKTLFSSNFSNASDTLKTSEVLEIRESYATQERWNIQEVDSILTHTQNIIVFI